MGSCLRVWELCAVDCGYIWTCEYLNYVIALLLYGFTVMCVSYLQCVSVLLLFVLWWSFWNHVDPEKNSCCYAQANWGGGGSYEVKTENQSLCKVCQHTVINLNLHKIHSTGLFLLIPFKLKNARHAPRWAVYTVSTSTFYDFFFLKKD